MKPEIDTLALEAETIAKEEAIKEMALSIMQIIREDLMIGPEI
jgi:hypothetical protein